MREIDLPLILLVSLCLAGAGCTSSKIMGNGERAGPAGVPSPSGQVLVDQGNSAFKKGDFAAAAKSWEQAARLLEQAGHKGKSAETFTKLSQAYQGLGQHGDALKAAHKALLLAKQDKDEKQTAEALTHLGNALSALGEKAGALEALEEGLRIAGSLGEASLSARILNNLGNLLASEEKYEEALRAYQESVALAGDKAPIMAPALVNAATVCLRLERYGKAESLLDRALPFLQEAEESYYKAHALINAGLLYSDLRSALPGRDAALGIQAFTALTEAVQVSQVIGDARTLSYAYGSLASLYEQQERLEEALKLNKGAVFHAQRSQAPESLYRWYWQSGRILRRLGRTAEAIGAYRQALSHFQTIRQELAYCKGGPDPSFGKTAGALCSQYVDLLLDYAGSAEDAQGYLAEAREALELVKVFELRDYFKDDCVDTARYAKKTLDALSEKALIIYPILLQDRLELLVRFPDGLKRYTVGISRERITREVREFRGKIEKRTTGEFLPHSQQLYDWLIRPFEKDLAHCNIDTLVFVPDGALRTIPMAALHDGKRYLVQQYATAITPGLNLTDPRPLKKDQVKVLSLGLTESVQDFPGLPYVSGELKAIHELYSGLSLLNQDFVAARVEEELKRQPFSIVHIASHGHFGKEVEDTFLLTFDDRLTMDRLGDYVGLFRFREEPLDLLTLSACETAAGDERAALGLAGIAIRAGARSALATLWHVSDPSSYRLVVEFYRRLQTADVSRASALQAAQVALLRDPRYDHPCYWAPFLLINNWL